MAPLASIAINALIPPLSLAAWLWILLGVGDSGQLAHTGIGSLKYFTVLSNLFSAVVSTIYLIACIQGQTPLAPWLVTLKLVAASAVMLTFLTVTLLLVPLYGWRSMYRGGNLWLHLILPLLAALDCCLFVPIRTIPIAMTLCAMLPTAAYAVFYLWRVFSHDAQGPDPEYDFYGFLRWGKEKTPIVLAAMLLATWGIALALRLCSAVCTLLLR